MPILHFEGCSDDTFGEYNHFKDDYDNCASGEPIDWLVKAPDGSGVIVSGQYGRGFVASWSIGVAAYDPDANDRPLPAWPMRIERGERPYSPRLVIEAPEGVRLERLE